MNLEKEDELVSKLFEWLEALGYRVDRGRVIGTGQVADIIATKDNDTTVVLEVKAGEHLPSHAFYEARSLMNSVASIPDFRNAVVVLGTSAHIGDAEVERYGKGGIRVMSLGNNVNEFRENLVQVLEQ